MQMAACWIAFSPGVALQGPKSRLSYIYHGCSGEGYCRETPGYIPFDSDQKKKPNVLTVANLESVVEAGCEGARTLGMHAHTQHSQPGCSWCHRRTLLFLTGCAKSLPVTQTPPRPRVRGRIPRKSTRTKNLTAGCGTTYCSDRACSRPAILDRTAARGSIQAMNIPVRGGRPTQ